jgi:hypothetical protein
MTLPESYLRTWPGRLRLPRLCVQLAAAADNDGDNDGGGGREPHAGQVTTALLQDLAADLDDAGALAWLLERNEFSCAADLIAGTPAIADDPDALRDAQSRLARRQAELRAQLGARAESLRDRAEAAGLPAPSGIAEPAADAEGPQLAELRDLLAAREAALDGQIEAAKRDAVKHMEVHKRRTGVPKPVLSAWALRVERGELVAAQRLLEVTESETALPPDAVPRLRAWDPTVDAPAMLERIAQPTYRGDWTPASDGRWLLSVYAALRDSGTEQAADAFSATLAEFLDAARARPPIPAAGGYSFRLDLSLTAEALPLAWLPDVKIVLCTAGRPLPTPVTAEERLIGIDCGTGAGPQRTPGRSNTAILTPGDLIRLSTAATHRTLHLLRLLGRGWSSGALGVGNAGALEALLSGPPALAWGRLSWLLDVADLGGTELAREMTDCVGLHPNGLHILLESLLRAPGSSREARRRRWAKLDTYSRLEHAVLPSPVPGPAGRVAFLALLAADGFDTPLQVPDLQLSVAVEGGDAPDRLLEQGLRALAHHPLVESQTDPEPAVRLRRCAVLGRMRHEAPRMLLAALDDAAGAEAGDAAGPGASWAGHRWALLPAGIGDRTVADALAARSEAIAAAGPAPEARDVIPAIEELAADCQAAFPAIRLELDLPAHAFAAVDPDALRTILAEVLQNAVDELAAAQRDLIHLVVRGDPQDILVDVIDDGNGVALPNPHAVFRRGRTTRGEGRGAGLHDADHLARNISAQLVLAAASNGGSLTGAHFHLALPRDPDADA